MTTPSFIPSTSSQLTPVAPLTEALAAQLDREDPLRAFRDQFHIPTHEDGSDEVYFCGNSLGLQPKRTRAYLNEELDTWATRGVRGHFESEHPWMPYHEFVTETSAALVGALPQEVVVMNSLTVNLHLMMVSFFKPQGARRKIMIEDHAFPSDRYAVRSQLIHHGLDPVEDLILLTPREGAEVIEERDILAKIEAHRDELALVLLPGVQYYTGQAFDFEAITAHCHQHQITVGFDLAHAVGNLELKLHEWGVDFAAWCSYKYLNSGPGSLAGCFVHERHVLNPELNRFAGWWGHDKATRFLMGDAFKPIPTAEGWQLSNPPILSLAAIRASLDVFKEAGGMGPLREKSARLTAALEQTLRAELGDQVTVITPERRGAQLSLQINSGARPGREVFERLEASGVRGDWREPNVIRVAPVPLYNQFSDVYRFVQLLKGALA